MLAVALVAGMLAAGCGKRGNPLPPLRPVPGRVTDLHAVRTADQIALTLVVPAVNADNSTPPAIDRLEIYAANGLAAAPAPPAAEITGNPANHRADIAVRPPPDPDAPAPESTAPAEPAPGDHATWIDRLRSSSGTGDLARHYVIVAVVGRGRGRRGPPSPVISVPLGDLPAPPDTISLTSDETAIRLAWTPSAPGQTFTVLTSPPPFTAATATVATPTPLQAPEYNTPVQFGSERCFAVRALQVTAAATLEGPLSPAHCLTPVDVYAPPAPANLQAIQEGAAVTLNWSGVPAPDLAGYIVLRSEGNEQAMVPLMREPIHDTSYHDQTVRTGGTYTYSVYAVDTAPVPNVSQQSNRQTLTVR
jgi:hypothetical protein